jgi:hypothetical protein
LSNVKNDYSYDNNKDKLFVHYNGSGGEYIAMDSEVFNKIQKVVLTSFVFLEVGFYKFNGSLYDFIPTQTQNFKIIIYENINGKPTTKKTLSNNEIFESNGGFYKIAICYSIYNNTGKVIPYQLLFKARYSLTQSNWGELSNMFPYLYNSTALYDNLYSSGANKSLINYLFCKGTKTGYDVLFRGYTTKARRRHCRPARAQPATRHPHPAGQPPRARTLLPRAAPTRNPGHPSPETTDR